MDGLPVHGFTGSRVQQGSRVQVRRRAADFSSVEFPSLTRRILVVDDDAARAAALVAVLDRAESNWLIETALSGRGALAALTARKFDLLITDLHVAGMGSGALLATAAIEHPRRRAPGAEHATRRAADAGRGLRASIRRRTA